MRVICLSDTHEQNERIDVPDGDVLVHAGDLTWTGDLGALAAAAEWLGSLPHPNKIVVAGNHDWAFARPGEREKARVTFEAAGLVYLEDEGVSLRGHYFYGSPWQPEFCNWAFNLERGGRGLRAKWDAILEQTTVLITHGPPHGLGDRNLAGERVGCRLLRERTKLLPNLKLHVFGHIHEGYGIYGDGHPNGCIYANASICNREYRPVNAPHVVELQEPK